MKERPILFSPPMVRAILEGRKTQTRRVINPQPQMVADRSIKVWSGDPAYLLKLMNDTGKRCPYGQPGDRLWVREKFQPLFADDIENHWETDWKTGKGYKISYPATDGIQEFIDLDDGLSDACKPSIHMPRWASRILLEVTGVRVERLQDINRGDSMAEGCPFPNMANGDDPRQWYSELWESINGTGSWDANPWVWVIEFKRVTP